MSVDVSESVRCVRETTTRTNDDARDDERRTSARDENDDDDDDDDPARVRTRIGRERDVDRVRFAEDDARAPTDDDGDTKSIVVGDEDAREDDDDERSGFTRQGENFIAVDPVDAVVGESESAVARTARAGESASRGDGARETGERGEVDGDEGRGRERDEEGRREIA